MNTVENIIDNNDAMFSIKTTLNGTAKAWVRFGMLNHDWNWYNLYME